MLNHGRLRAFSLALLVSAATSVVAAPAPVIGLNNGSIEKLERMLEARTQMQLDMQRQLDLIANDLSNLRGTVEKNSFEINQMRERQRDLYKEIDGLKLALEAKPQPEILIQEASDEVYSSNQAENVEYDAAVNLILKEKNYSGAINAFEAFLTKYPQSVYKPNAHYWLGQLFFSKQDLEAAKKHFTAVSQYRDSNKRADALLKLGLIAGKQNDSKLANNLFKQVIDGYPGSGSANQAQKLVTK